MVSELPWALDNSAIFPIRLIYMAIDASAIEEMRRGGPDWRHPDDAKLLEQERKQQQNSLPVNNSQEPTPQPQKDTRLLEMARAKLAALIRDH